MNKLLLLSVLQDNENIDTTNPFTGVKGIGKKTAELLTRAGFEDIGHLLSHDKKEIKKRLSKLGIKPFRMKNIMRAIEELR